MYCDILYCCLCTYRLVETVTEFDKKSEPGLQIIKLEYSLKLKIKCNDWLLVDTCPQAANYCALF